jgi:cell division protein FtsB
MLSFLTRAIFGSPSRDADERLAPIVDEAIEKALDATDPRIRALGGYGRALREPVTRAVHFVHELGEGLPAPTALSRAAFSTDPLLQAFFSSAARVQEVLSKSQEIQGFLKEPGHAGLERLYGALAMTRSERRVLVPVLRGENVQHDVERTLVSFDEHRVALPAADERALRRAFKERAFFTLVECALERMSERRERKEELQKGRAMLRAKLKALRSSHSGLDALSGASSRADTAAVERRLAEAERALEELNASGGELERGLQDLGNTLSQPEQHIAVETMRLRLDRMAYVVEAQSTQPSNEVQFLQVAIAGGPTVSGVLAWFPRTDLKDADSYRDSMRRALGAGGG